MPDRRSVIPIPALYDKNENLSRILLLRYVRYLQDNNASTLMTTAGTSQFNLLSLDHINDFNQCICIFKNQKILGLPALNLRDIKNVISTNSFYREDGINLMLLYPERFYNEDTLYDYFKNVYEIVEKPIYIHAMAIRNGLGGNWEYSSNLLNRLFHDGILLGIKEEYSNLQDSYNFIYRLDRDIDVIVAGGSMRRYNYLQSAGANSFLAGIGNFYPQIEERYLLAKDRSLFMKMEDEFFNVFNKYGWHRSLRAGMGIMNFTESNLAPWPKESEEIKTDVFNALSVLGKYL